MRSYVVRGRVTRGQKANIEKYWDLFGLNVEGSSFSEESFFKRNTPYILDIGFGMGDSLIALAAHFPNHSIIGVDVHTPGIGSILGRLAESSVENVRIIKGDIMDMLRDYFPSNYFERIYTLFPDPWHKARHNKRRLINQDFLERVKDVLVEEGHLLLATDSDDYYFSIRDNIERSVYFSLSQQPDFYPETKFGLRSKRGGSTIHYCNTVVQK